MAEPPLISSFPSPPSLPLPPIARHQAVASSLSHRVAAEPSRHRRAIALSYDRVVVRSRRRVKVVDSHAAIWLSGDQKYLVYKASNWHYN